MIITDKFVMLNFPKTGSSFARSALKSIYRQKSSRKRLLAEKLGICKPSMKELMFPKIDEISYYGIKDQHGTLRQIPRAHQYKPVVTITRNPFSRYISTYLYRWWKRYPPAEEQVICERYPNFPDLSFSEYYEMMHEYGRRQRLQNLELKIDLGIHSIQFIQFYFNDPEAILKGIDSDYIEQARYEDDLRNISFIHQENLRKDLVSFLLKVGFEEKDIEFIEQMEKVNVTDKKGTDGDNISLYLRNDVGQKIMERDRLLFRIFPEYLTSC